MSASESRTITITSEERRLISCALSHLDQGLRLVAEKCPSETERALKVAADAVALNEKIVAQWYRDPQSAIT